MNNYDDPRVVLSYMDSSLEPARDILRLTTEVSDNQELVFQVKMRGEGAKSGARDYVLLQVWQDRSHLWLVPLRLDQAEGVLAYEMDRVIPDSSQVLVTGELAALAGDLDFTASRIQRGVEFSVPLSWLDYREEIGFDAYTVRGRPAGDSFVIEEVYDQAAKGSRDPHRVSPIKLLNNLCATRR